MKRHPTRLVASATDLQLLALEPMPLLPRHERIEIVNALLPEHERESWEALLGRLRSDCGCRTGGAVAAMLSLSVAIFCGVFCGGGVLLTFGYWLSVAATFFLGGFAGKVIGLSLARRRLHSALSMLTDRLCGLEAGNE